jgi:Uma2 family endonuclease
MNVPWTRAGEGFPRRAFTVEEISRLLHIGMIGEDDRIELVEGELIVMASKGFAHERIKSALLVAIARALPQSLTLGAEMTMRLDDTTLLEPDIVVFPRSAFQHPVSGFVSVGPGEAQLIVEVAYSSLNYDKGLKARLYARHGVREFWVVDANEQVTWIHTQPSGDTWTSIVKRGSTDILTTDVLPGFAIRLDQID